MVKDSTSIKKRRKNTVPTENDGEVDIYTKVVEFEEKESAQRAAEDDANIYFDLCKNIRNFLADALIWKKENTNEARAKIQKGLTEACVMIAVLKKLNRLDKFRTITARESLNTEKQRVDSTNLQYHNLLYEAAHLVSEYTKCKQFKVCRYVVSGNSNGNTRLADQEYGVPDRCDFCNMHQCIKDTNKV